jgi:HK97 family phage portal protein
MIAEFLSSLLPSPRASLENPRFNLNDPAAYDALCSSPSESGMVVTPETAMTLAPFWQMVSIISGDVATSTANIFERVNGNDRDIARDHPANFLISTRPNDDMSAFDLWRRAIVHAIIWQNGYLYIEKQGGVGRPLGLYNLLPDRTRPARDDNGSLYYITEVDGRPHSLSKEEVLHIKGLSISADIGFELVKAARNCLGLSLAAEGFDSKFFANGAQAGGILEVPPGTDPAVADKLADALKRKYTGKDNWFKTMVLRDGAKFHQLTIDAQKSQLTEVREHQVRDVARFGNLPPHKLGLSDSVSYNSSEQSQIQYITGCLTHWFGSIRGEAQLKLLTEKEQRTESHFIDFNTSKLIERDLKTQVEILAIERQNEIINASEWRRKLNMSPRTDPKAEEYMNPNTKSNQPEPAKTEPAKDEPAKEPKPEPKNSLTPAAQAVCEDAIGRITRRVTAHARNTAKSTVKFEAWLTAGAIDHRDLFNQAVTPAANLAAELCGWNGVDLCHVWSGRFFASLSVALAPLMQPPYLANQLEQNVDQHCTLFESAVCAELLGNLIRRNDDAEINKAAA